MSKSKKFNIGVIGACVCSLVAMACMYFNPPTIVFVMLALSEIAFFFLIIPNLID